MISTLGSGSDLGSGVFGSGTSGVFGGVTSGSAFVGVVASGFEAREAGLGGTERI